MILWIWFRVVGNKGTERAGWTGEGCAVGLWFPAVCANCWAPTLVHLHVELRFEKIFLWKQKGTLIRLVKGGSVDWRLALWFRSLVLTSASPPKTTATNHFLFRVYRGVSLQSRMKFLRHDLIHQAVLSLTPVNSCLSPTTDWVCNTL